MSRTIIGRYAMAAALGLAFAGQLALHASGQSIDAHAQHSGAGAIIGLTYGIKPSGQEHHPD